jgi:AcrR family transcriptional regulator
MQVKKDLVERRVINAARSEFLEKGFKNTTMRSISRKADTSLSNIYNYFQNKNAILETLLKDAIASIESSMDERNGSNAIDLDEFMSKEYWNRRTEEMVDLIMTNRDELKILLLRSQGSSLENYKERYTEKHTEVVEKFLRDAKNSDYQLNTDISHFFIHTMSSWWIGIMEELVMHDLEEDDIKRFISEHIEYSTSGWRGLMKLE